MILLILAILGSACAEQEKTARIDGGSVRREPTQTPATTDTPAPTLTPVPITENTGTNGKLVFTSNNTLYTWDFPT